MLYAVCGRLSSFMRHIFHFLICSNLVPVARNIFCDAQLIAELFLDIYRLQGNKNTSTSILGSPCYADEKKENDESWVDHLREKAAKICGCRRKTSRQNRPAVYSTLIKIRKTSSLRETFKVLLERVLAK